jgi:hypothetical protein
MGGEKINHLKNITGISRADCYSCAYGHEETDGEYGQIYCGWLCEMLTELLAEVKLDEEPLYVDDLDIPLHMEKECWEPNFWISIFPEEAHSTNDTKKAYKRFVKAIREKREQ